MTEPDNNDDFEFQNEILSEYYEYSTNCARSDEDGWFYLDDDEDNGED